MDTGSLVYKVVYSDRRSLGMEITAERQVLVRSPRRMTGEAIERFVQAHTAWAQNKLQSLPEAQRPYTKQEEKALRQKARQLLPGLVGHYAGIMQVKPCGFRVNAAKTRFGSCSAKGWLNFSYRLFAYPDRAIEYVVVHELAHLKHMNHGQAFYQTIKSVFPDYREREKLLKKKSEG